MGVNAGLRVFVFFLPGGLSCSPNVRNTSTRLGPVSKRRTRALRHPGPSTSGSLAVSPSGGRPCWEPSRAPATPLAAVALHDSCSIKVGECAADTGQTSNAHRGGRGQSVRTLRGCPGATWCRGGQPKSAHKGLGIAETLNGVCFTVFTTDLGFHQKRGFLLWGSALVLFCLFFKILGF